MKRLLGWLVIPLALLAAWALVGTDDTVRLAHPLVSLAGKQVPLPDRSWVVGGTAREYPSLPSGSTVVDNLVVFGVDADAVAAFVVIHANAVTAAEGWGISRDCKNPDEPFTAIFEHRDHHYKCAFVQELEGGPVSAAWPVAAALAARQHWRLPDHWVVAGFRIADRLDVIDVRYGFDPRGMAGASKIAGAPAVDAVRQAALQALIHWQETALYWVERGFRNQLDGETPLPLPRLADGSSPSPVATSRLRQLVALRDAGWLSTADFAAQRAIIVHASDTETDLNVDIWRLGALKTTGHTVQTTFWMWGINYLFLGNAYLAGGLALTKAVVSPTRYYLEELAWNTWGPRRNPELPVVDFYPVAAR